MLQSTQHCPPPQVFAMATLIRLQYEVRGEACEPMLKGLHLHANYTLKSCLRQRLRLQISPLPLLSDLVRFIPIIAFSHDGSAAPRRRGSRMNRSLTDNVIVIQKNGTALTTTLFLPNLSLNLLPFLHLLNYLLTVSLIFQKTLFSLRTAGLNIAATP
jgi:hypothetical protein